MNKPKYEIGDCFVSANKGKLKIMSSRYSDIEQDFIYAVEYTDYDSMLFGCHSEKEIMKFLGENYE